MDCRGLWSSCGVVSEPSISGGGDLQEVAHDVWNPSILGLEQFLMEHASSRGNKRVREADAQGARFLLEAVRNSPSTSGAHASCHPQAEALIAHNISPA